MGAQEEEHLKRILLKRNQKNGFNPSFIVTGRGFSRSSFDGLHTLSEKPEDQVITPPHQKVAFYYEEDETDLQPKRCNSPLGMLPSSVAEESSGSHTMSESCSWSFSDNLTGRSSVYSWGNDDEFDKQASATVKKMFEEIDSILFERTATQGNDQLREECKEWSTTFPHLRILGTQVLPPTDVGTEMILVGDKEHTDQGSGRIKEAISELERQPYHETINGLNICGQKLDVQSPPVQPIYAEGSTHPFIHLEEEVFAVDGNVEEYFAFDSIGNCDYAEKRQDKGVSRGQRHPGYPPVTPNAFFRDTVLSEIFDQLWLELVAALRSLLKLIIEKCGKDLSKSLLASTRQSDHTSSSILRSFSRDGYSKIPHLPSQLRVKTASGPLSVSSDLNGLKELMTIRSVPLQQRAPSVAALTLRDEEAVHTKDQTRPVSSTFSTSKALANRPLSMRNSDHQIFSRMTSARSIKRNGRLQPLQPLDRSKTPAIQDNHVVGEVLRGTRLQTASDSTLSPSALSNLSPQPWGARNGMLPPIERIESMETLSLGSNARSPKQRGMRTGTRASSAATDETSIIAQNVRQRDHAVSMVQQELPAVRPFLESARRPSYRERTSSNVDSRPNTTHSSRSEMQHILSRRLPTTPFGTTTIMSRGSMTVSSSYHGNPLGVLQGISMPVNNAHATTESQMGGHAKSVSFDEEPDVDELVLWGHGPPLISHHSRKGRTNVR